MRPSDHNSRNTRYSLISMGVTVITVTILAVFYFVRSGVGPAVASDLITLLVCGGLGLASAFVIALAAMIRGEEPVLLTLLALALPPAVVAFLILRR
jgi:hypothetical protein